MSQTVASHDKRKTRRKGNVKSTLPREKRLQQRKQGLKGPKAISFQRCRIAAKTIVFFPACFAHACYSSWMIDNFLNWGDHGKPNRGKIKGRWQPIESASSRYCERQLVIKNDSGDSSQLHVESAKYFEWFIVLIITNISLFFTGSKPLALTNCGSSYFIDSRIYWLGNEIYRWYIWLEIRLHGQYSTIDQPHLQTVAVYSLVNFRKIAAMRRRNCWISVKMEQKNCENKQNILLDWFCPLCGCYLQCTRGVSARKKNICLYPETVQRKQSKFRRKFT